MKQHKPAPEKKTVAKKHKGSTQPRTPMQRVMILRNNKKIMEWREWGS